MTETLQDSTMQAQDETVAVPSTVRRIRFAEMGGRIVIGLNVHAARDLMDSRAFWEAMRSHGQRPVYLRPEDHMEGLFSDQQLLLRPSEPGADLGRQDLQELAAAMVDGTLVPEWNVTPDMAPYAGVIVCDSTKVKPHDEFDYGPGNSDVLASSIDRYLPRGLAV